MAHTCTSCAANSKALATTINGIGGRKRKKGRSGRIRGVDSAQASLLFAGIGGGVAAAVVDNYALSKVAFISDSPILKALVPTALGAAMAFGYVGKNPMIKAAGVGMASFSAAKYIAEMIGISGIGNSYVGYTGYTPAALYDYPGSSSEINPL